MRRKVAIIGGGVAGLTAGYLLNRKHDVTLFEKSGRIGGNAYTYVTPDGEAPDIAVAAFGKAGYKKFHGLLSELAVETQAPYDCFMSFHDLDSGSGLYLTPSIKRALAQRFEMLRPRNLRSFAGLFVGLHKAQGLLETGALEGRSLEECLALVPELQGDARLIFLCALTLLSSMDSSDILAAPAAFFLGKLRAHHDVLSAKALFSVRCVKNGTRAYVNALAAGFRRKIVFNARVKTVVRRENGVLVVMEDGSARAFDKIVFACNADQALALLESPTKSEQQLLGAWRYRDGRVVVHRDCSAFPPRDMIESYTFLHTRKDGPMKVSVNGALWRLPHVSGECEYLSSQHPNFPIRPELVALETTLRTPIFDFRSCATVDRLPSLNNVRDSFFCGSHFGYGLHEDAVASALAAAAYF